MTEVIYIIIIGVVIVLVWSMTKSYRLHRRLTGFAETYPTDFRAFVESVSDWEVTGREQGGAGCIRLTPRPRLSADDFYHIRFVGPQSLSEEVRIEYLLASFEKYMFEKCGSDYKTRMYK